MKKTMQYYQQNTEQFIANTVAADFSSIANEFLKYLTPSARILDFGCGSGRDTRYFLEHGFSVDAVDGSPEICAWASKYTGIPVQCMLFQDLDAEGIYDGIWACASILHVPAAELPGIFDRMIRALKPGGIIYASFKYGRFEGERNGRYFTDFTSETFAQFLGKFPQLELLKEWITGDVREGRRKEKWLNLILRKQDLR